MTTDEHRFLLQRVDTRDDRAHRRLAVDARADLRDRVAHAEVVGRIHRGNRNRHRGRHQHGVLGGPLRHGHRDGPRQPARARSITGVGTFIGGILHTLPFLIPNYHVALVAAVVVVAFELVTLAYLRYRFFATSFFRSFASVTLGGMTIVIVSAALGSI